MKQHLRRTSVRIVLIVVSAFGAVLLTVDAVWSVQETKEVSHMSKQMKTVCVGRFLIDVPANAQVTLSRASVQGLDVVNYGVESREAFAMRVENREKNVNAEKNITGDKNMVAVREVHDGQVEGKVFVFGRSSGYLFEDGVKVLYSSVAVDGFVRVDGMTFGFHASAYDPQNVDNLEGLFKRLHPLSAGVVPAQPGFCIDGALLGDPLTAGQNESIVMFAGLPGHEDLGIALSTIAGKTPGPSLLERNDANRAGPYAFLNAFHSTLLHGRRTINGIEGDELAFRTRERNFSTGYTFDWETQGTESDVMHPFVSLELQTGISAQAGGAPVQSTLSEASLADLWRRMSSSLRLRPVEQPAEAFDPDLQLGLALGTLAWAGEPCRQSGWWQCGQADDRLGVFGGAVQFLREGQVVPQALLLPRPSVWQKVRGLQPGFESATPTSWRLADKRVRARHHDPAGLAPAAPAALALDTDGAAAALGSTVDTGAMCPASGWWRCVDDQAEDGARWFAQGAVLPPATYRQPASGMQRAARRDRLVVYPSSWRLMRAAPAVPGAHVAAGAATPA